MNKIMQSLFAAEFARFARGDDGPLNRLDDRLLPLFKENFLREDVPKIQRRVRSLKELPAQPDPDSHYLASHGVRGVMRYRASNEATIYKIPVFSFAMTDWKDHWTSVYIVRGKSSLTLVDTGTHLSEESLREGLEVVGKVFGESMDLKDIEHIVITHAHFDHFGGLAYAHEATGAELWVHEWDAHTISNYPSEVARARERIALFCRQAGMPEEEIGALMKMHEVGKRVFPGYPVRHAFSDHDRIVEDFEVIHTPGHCPGLSCIRIGDVILLGDHVLNHVTPHQFPKIYTSGSGLLNYLNSLIKITARGEGVRLGLPSHYGDILEIEERVMEIIAEHNQRIADLIKDLDHPKTLSQITEDYYRFRKGRVLSGYERLLALEEIGAHVEYMIETLGILRIAGGGDPAPESGEVLLYEASP